MSLTSPHKVLRFLTAVATATCVASAGELKLESLLPPPSAFTGACSPAPAKDGYSNPHVSSDATFLATAAELGGSPFPVAQLREVALAYYGSPMMAGLALYRFEDGGAAETAARKLKAQSDLKSEAYRTEVFRKGTVVAMAWEHRGTEPSCLPPILRHYESVLR